MLNKEESLLLQQIDQKALIDFLQKLVQSNSENPPGNEMEVAHLIRKKLEAIGCAVKIQEIEENRFNVMGLLTGENKEQLLFNGHMDTVCAGKTEYWTKDPFGGEISEGKLFGRGATDMKSGIVAMLFALDALAKSRLPRKKSILFTAVIDEEVFFKGTQGLIEANLLKDCTMAYVSEPTSLALACGLQGAAEFILKVYGKSAHSGMAEQGINAIFQMNQIIDVLYQYHQSLQFKGHELNYMVNPSINIGRIKGGNGVTLVPDYCEIEFDRQVLPGENLPAAIKEIEALINQTCQKNNINGELIVNQSFNCWQMSKDHAVAADLISCHTKVTGKAPEDILFRGYCEAEMLASQGIPAAIYGPGSILVAHRPDEYVEIEEVITAAQTYALLAYNFVK